MPSINEFLEQLDSNDETEKSYLGFALSAFSLTGLIFSPVYGRITDKTSSIKLTIVFSNLFEIGGQRVSIFLNVIHNSLKIIAT